MIQVFQKTQKFTAHRPGGRGRVDWVSFSKVNPIFFTPETDTDTVTNYKLIRYDRDAFKRGFEVIAETINLALLPGYLQPKSEVYGNGYRFYIDLKVIQDSYDYGIYAIEINEFRTDAFELREYCGESIPLVDSAGDTFVDSSGDTISFY